MKLTDACILKRLLDLMDYEFEVVIKQHSISEYEYLLNFLINYVKSLTNG